MKLVVTNVARVGLDRTPVLIGRLELREGSALDPEGWALPLHGDEAEAIADEMIDSLDAGLTPSAANVELTALMRESELPAPRELWR